MQLRVGFIKPSYGDGLPGVVAVHALVPMAWQRAVVAFSLSVVFYSSFISSGINIIYIYIYLLFGLYFGGVVFIFDQFSLKF